MAGQGGLTHAPQEDPERELIGYCAARLRSVSGGSPITLRLGGTKIRHVQMGLGCISDQTHSE